MDAGIVRNNSKILGAQMNEVVNKRQKERFHVLNKLYELSEGDGGTFVNGADLAEACGFTEMESLSPVVRYLEGDGLAKAIWVAGGVPVAIQISHQGIVEIESANKHPNSPTEHFAPHNVLFVNTMIGSAIQQGTTHSSQTASSVVSADVSEQLKQFVELASKLIETGNVTGSHWDEMRAEIDTLRAQAKSPHPKVSILRDSLACIGRLCEGAAAGAIGEQLAPYIPVLLALLA